MNDALTIVKENEKTKYVENIKKVGVFLKENDFHSTNEIVAFAKIFFYYINRDQSKPIDDLLKHIEENAPYVWKSLMDYKNKFPTYLKLSQNLQEQLV